MFVDKREEGKPLASVCGGKGRAGRRIPAATLGCLLAGAAPVLAQTVPTPLKAAPPKWGPHIDFEGKAGNKRNIGEADVFVPLWQNSDTLVFGNVKTRLDDDNSKEGNFGAGVRHMLPSGWNVGGYGYFDRRKTEHGNYFNQVTLGAEALSLDWDLRANVYLPEGRRSKNVDSLNTAEISGTTVIFRGGEERSLRGFDGEIGWRVPVFDLDAGRALRIYGGAYRFYADGVDPVQGPRARAELTFDEVPYLWEGSRLTLGAEAQHDGPRGGQVFAVARLRIPLQVFGETRTGLTPLERRMTDPTVRDVDVVSQAGAFGAPESATLTNGMAITAISSTTTSGAALPGAITAAGNNSTVILSGTFDVSTGITPQTGQTIMAGTVQVRSPSGRTAILTSPATVTSSQAGSTFNLTNPNSTLTGLTISVANSNAVVVEADGGVVSNNTISSGDIGIHLNAGTNLVVSGNTITATNTALLLSPSSGAVSATVSGNTLSATNHTDVDSNFNPVTILGGSTGNVIVSGACASAGGQTTGSISYTNGSTCP